MSTTASNPGQSWQPAPTPPAQGYGSPAPQYAPPAPQYAPPAQEYAQQRPAVPSTTAAHGSILRRWPTWAQNTALAVGAAAIVVVVFFAGYFTANAVNSGPTGIETNQNFSPRQFGGQSGSSGSQSGSSSSQSGNGFGDQSGTTSGGQSGYSNGS